MLVKKNYKFMTLANTQERIEEVKNILGIGDNAKIVRNEKNNKCEFLHYGTHFCNYNLLLKSIESLYKTTYPKIFIEVRGHDEEDCEYVYNIYVGKTKKDSLSNWFEHIEIKVKNLTKDNIKYFLDYSFCFSPQHTQELKDFLLM